MKILRQRKRRGGRAPLPFPPIDLHPRTKNWIAGVLVALFAVLMFLSLLGAAGPAGNWLAKVFYRGFGWGAWLMPLLGALIAIVAFTSQRHFIGASLFGGGLMFCAFLALLSFVGKAGALRGGIVGKWIAWPALAAVGKAAAMLIFVAIGVIGIFVLFNFPASGRTRSDGGEAKIPSGVKDWTTRPRRPSWFPFPFFARRHQSRDAVPPIRGLGAESGSAAPSSFRIRSLEKPVSFDEAMADRTQSDWGRENAGRPHRDGASDNLIIPSAPSLPYSPPPLDLFEHERGNPRAGDIRANMAIVKRTFANFGIAVEMGEVTVGPTVTQYTLKPAEGVKVAQIKALENDLALALAAHPIRIEAPIPGRSLVGIEVPNQAVTLVRVRNLLEESLYRDSSYRLAIAVGRDVAGAPIVTALEKMPHLLIAGATGTGKTIALNALLLSLLFRNPPSLLRAILIDPKRVEFPVYNGIPHLLTQVIVDIEKTIHALRWAVGEMERRFDILSHSHARDIGAYNRQLGRDQEPMPYLVIVIDELADIMAARGRDAEASIVRLAQMARAVGIHLVVATQRPSVEVITGLIKANITTRMAFQVASQVDSRTILDTAGAEKLLGNGDMLFVTAETSKPRRLQGVYVSEKEVKRVTDFLKTGVPPHYEEGVTEALEGEGGEWLGNGGSMGGDDPLYEEAKRLVIQMRKASASYLQRRLRVGYARAARLIDLLEERGVVGQGDGAKPREVLLGVDGKTAEGEEWT